VITAALDVAYISPEKPCGRLREYEGISMTKKHQFNAQTQYRIKLKERLDVKWSNWFEGMVISTENGKTTLTGQVADQSALHGLLTRIRDLNLTLLSVERIEPDQNDMQ
jgi:hypothetical protein